jgi:hypothetical protein
MPYRTPTVAVIAGLAVLAGGSPSSAAPGGPARSASAAPRGAAGSASAPPRGALVPATFKIRPGGRLSPPTVFAVVAFPVRITVISGDGRAHRVLLGTPTRHTLSVPAGGRASVTVPGLRTGRYRISVDGVARGALVVGFTPGP